MEQKFLAWIAAAGIRALKTFAETMLGGIAVGSVGFGGVDWAYLASVAGVAAVASILWSIAGLPELEDADGDGFPEIPRGE
jgi:hypothetical protein